jgi:cytochrome c6
MKLTTLFLAMLAATLPYAARAADGKALFAKNCAACHQAKGQGIAGAFPPLAGSAFVQGATDDVAAVLLKGRGGMPDFSSAMNDEEIAAVLSFVRSSWGNKADGLEAAQVGVLRDALQVPRFAAGRMSNKH